MTQNAVPISAGPMAFGAEHAHAAVLCSSGTACTAVADFTTTTASGKLIGAGEGWDGTRWTTQVVTKPVQQLGSGPRPILCFTAPRSACTAAPHWPAGATGVIYGIPSCSSSASCTEVGEYVNASGATLPLAEHWNGTAWSFQTVPNPADATPHDGLVLSAVSCPSSTACVAVGSYSNSNGRALIPLVERWNGTKWTIQSVPAGGGRGAGLTAVSCSSGSACTAVGHHTTSGGTEQTFAVRYS